MWSESRVVIYVEYNLGFEAEHHEKALGGLFATCFRVDLQGRRIGFNTTQSVKHAATEALNVMMREGRVHLMNPVLSRDPPAMRKLLREQLTVFSYQRKQATDVFGKDRVAISGKVGGMVDDVCCCLILGNYFVAHDIQHGKIPLDFA
jgi:hypothetical protein